MRDFNRREFLGTLAGGALAGTSLMAPNLIAPAFAAPYGLRDDKPFAGTTLNILSVVTPQFEGLMLRDAEFTEITGIKTNWTFIPFASLQEKVSSVGIAADGNFDVVNYLDTWGPPNAHWLQPIDDRLQSDGISMARYPQAFAKSAQYQGRTMGFPLRAHAQLMFRRADLIPDAPQSWDDVIEIGRELKAKGDIAPLALYYHNDGNRQNLFIWLNFLWAAGADIFDENNRAAWASDAGIAATEDYIGLHTREQITNPSSLAFVEQDARQSFQQGKSAMIPVWWWAYSGFINPKSSQLSAEQVAFSGMPAYNGRTVTYAISMPFSISQYSKSPDAAWEFLKWLSNPDLERRNATEREVAGKSIVNNVVTHIENLQSAQVNAANNNIQAAAWASLENSNIMPQVPEWTEVGDLLSVAIARAAAGGNVRELMSDAAKQADRVMARA